MKILDILFAYRYDYYLVKETNGEVLITYRLMERKKAYGAGY